MKRIVLASNRLPVTIVNRPEGTMLAQSGRGLAGALRELHERSPLDYDAYSTAVLWPLFHYLLDNVRVDARDDWRAYVELNGRFADAIAAQVKPTDAVWIHDYQLALVPALLRELVPWVRIGFFLHIPWPSSDVFRILPSCKQILAGLLGADLIGFQTDNDRHHFLQSTREVLHVEASTDGVPWRERSVLTGVYPNGIDVDAFSRHSQEIDTTVAWLRAEMRDKIVVLGVDELDPIKGLVQRLLGIDRLLAREPALRERLHFIQLTIPHRENIDPYPELRSRVNELVTRINSQYGSATSSPVQLLCRRIPRDQLIALYRAADVMLVTPLRDGMNLVAKEYVAARTDGRGCLVLSEFAGAASELTGALRVNPHDISALAKTTQRAMLLLEHEQRARMSELRRVVSEQSVRKWADDFLSDLIGHTVAATSLAANM